jgi:hypothetical protein
VLLRDVDHLRRAVCTAEEKVLFAPLGDPAAEALRDQACALTVDLLGTLGGLERCLAGERPEQQETFASWVARQAAPSDVIHQPKPNGRGREYGRPGG